MGVLSHDPAHSVAGGANYPYGMELSSSIVFTDSVPLFALALKPFAQWLPYPFQYLGAWLLTCFLLQSLFSYHLVKLLTGNRAIAAAGAVLLTAAPIFIFRLLLSHYAGAGHWIVLAALYCYFNRGKTTTLHWALLLPIAMLVNVYLAVMAFAIFAAWILTTLKLKTDKKRYIFGISAVCCSTLMAMGAAGYFMAGKYTADQGFGFYRLNFLSLAMPPSDWSLIMPSRTYNDGEFEGFAYLGVGTIALVTIGLAGLLRSQSLQPSTTEPQEKQPKHLVLILINVALVLFALSNHISFGNMTLLEYSLPSKFWPIASSFRASGRFVLPMYYLTAILGIVLVYRRFRPSTAYVILCTCVLLQLIDNSIGYTTLHDKLIQHAQWDTPLKSPMWNDLARNRDAVVVTDPNKHHPQYLPIAHLALKHKLTTNAVYFARIDQHKLATETAKFNELYDQLQLNRRYLYIVPDDMTQNLKAGIHSEDIKLQTIDGLNVMYIPSEAN